MRSIRLFLSALAVLGAGALMCSCENVKEIDVLDKESQTLNLVLRGISTRAETATDVATNSYPLDFMVDDQPLCLEETVTEMGDFVFEDAPGTRGTPIYTENLLKFYGPKFNGVVYGTSGQLAGDGEFELMDNSSRRWRRVLDFDPWLVSNPLTLFLRMPATQPGVSNLAYTSSSATMAFDFITPSTASDQKDILFATRTLTKSQYDDESASSNGGASVLFRHALTGVKFAIANNASQNGIRTFITSVTLTGLKDKGHAVFSPVGDENTSQVDVPSQHTSAGSFTWTDGSLTIDRTATYTQSFSSDQIRNFTSGDAVEGPTSFYAGGANNNLNDANASLTFWFVPQAITADLKLTVTFYLLDGTDQGATHTLELALGSEILAQPARNGVYTNREWKAGQLRTFTLKPDHVDLEITDTMSGYTSSTVAIRNTSNVPVYIRALIVANWYGSTDSEEEVIAAGFESQTSDEYVKSWQMANATTDNYGGTFTGLPGSNWEKGPDGFYYYTQPVSPGLETPSKLFQSYTLPSGKIPKIWYLDGTRKQFSDVHLKMEIPVQAIEAKTGKTYIQAWSDVGVTGLGTP